MSQGSEGQQHSRPGAEHQGGKAPWWLWVGIGAVLLFAFWGAFNLCTPVG